ncbi:hypothetical protein NHH03_25785 [Stieleria sp. TO1_6]|uniref:hypothetical protein n=1 Tax=Stieleria tagensis TaxID=2956795 RepID=UPI00209B9D66|nr:hypothetical protein [Stieleria tagensis]MCO8125174.1 hypothetical protein [Stieleria tagensis]
MNRPTGQHLILAKLCWLAVVGVLSSRSVVLAQPGIDIEAPPIEYSETPANNRVSRLIDSIESKAIELEYTREHGYLRSLLAALEIPESSQTLVFSKTSMQVRHISRRNPRAIYFNDDTYVGWVRGSTLMEISTADPKLGAAFYTVDMMPWRAKMEQATYDCLACHVTSMTLGVPGHTVRSVFPNVDGSVDSQRQSYITDHTSPFSQRWGGWYVTGRHGEMPHMGNSYLRGGQLDLTNNGNRLSLWDDFDAHSYLSPLSDIVALMVLEHQSMMHNVMTRADFTIRKQLYDQSAIKASAENEAEWQLQCQMTAKQVVDCLLFCGEAALTSAVNGSVIFADDFVKQGPTDQQGRSLREFDLKTRLFKYPCSYLIYSPAFDALQKPLRDQILKQLREVLRSPDPGDDYQHLDATVRAEIDAILRATKPGY